jgi:uncharacterized protein GlcG (DUF336 family)
VQQPEDVRLDGGFGGIVEGMPSVDLAHVRMDGAQIGSINHSINKAFTSVACRSSTEALGRDAQPGAQFFGVANSIEGRVIVFAGGIPLMQGGHIVGGVGASGGSREQDVTIAEAAAAAL